MPGRWKSYHRARPTCQPSALAVDRFHVPEDPQTRKGPCLELSGEGAHSSGSGGLGKQLESQLTQAGAWSSGPRATFAFKMDSEYTGGSYRRPLSEGTVTCRGRAGVSQCLGFQCGQARKHASHFLCPLSLFLPSRTQPYPPCFPGETIRMWRKDHQTLV